ncbi:O-methyltransferase [Corynebacterium sp. TAE3-ERU12]|uniref:O-methyltransferase n=1 Tax=Corynebacterium sp. TAE3-ERU12 TaxID=2849491 RepID=UPI001C47CC26|nr:O-methyltransferase [Corynebacterium sp. TAE3-ERU12]MBV7295061.1 O-methyltransferase [Corynebacterium sp. TAE3-ERU12]
MTNSASPREAIRAHISATTADDEALAAARDAAAELSLPVPSPADGEALQLIAALATSSTGGGGNCVVAAPAAGVIGIHLLAGMAENGHISCIDPDTEHQRLAKEAINGYRTGSAKHRFLPARPTDVMGRLATDSYDLIYAEVAPADLMTVRDLAWPLLRKGGVLVLGGSLLDGTIADDSRHDRVTTAARDADAELRATSGALVARMDICGGATVLHKR